MIMGRSNQIMYIYYTDIVGQEHEIECKKSTYNEIIKEFMTLERYFKSLGIHIMKDSAKIDVKKNKTISISIIQDWDGKYSYNGPIGKALSISVFDWHYGKMKDVTKRFSSYQEAKDLLIKQGYKEV